MKLAIKAYLLEKSSDLAGCARSVVARIGDPGRAYGLAAGFTLAGITDAGYSITAGCQLAQCEEK